MAMNPGTAVHAGFNISSGYGVRIDPLGGGMKMHHGIDLPGRHGSAILAAGPGIVRFAGVRGGYGNLIEIAHDDGSRTRYGHLASISVQRGDMVTTGDPIGTMGATGRATGTHLHFEVRKAGQSIDPLPCFAPAAWSGNPVATAASRIVETPIYRSAYAAAIEKMESGEVRLPSGVEARMVLP